MKSNRARFLWTIEILEMFDVAPKRAEASTTLAEESKGAWFSTALAWLAMQVAYDHAKSLLG
ncbi:hypothetical protein [Lampropedia aestuarii]|uniref:hypothetical protein n=1 Tax=Lampropedia aestuarii TaxID=2562762 RepID=UPI0024687088|nr:hypothetical protein [Lampropedia aestuarii]MDH5858651.1 hypothetical protein [Lampropedia aestuarii]